MSKADANDGWTATEALFHFITSWDEVRTAHAPDFHHHDPVPPGQVKVEVNWEDDRRLPRSLRALVNREDALEIVDVDAAAVWIDVDDSYR